MYIARIPEKGTWCRYRYIIRQSYWDGSCYCSRDLYDLGDDPSRFIIYPGGNGFYIDTGVEEAIAEKNVAVSQDVLESLFMPFLAPSIKRVINGFDRKSRHHQAQPNCLPVDTLHLFDRRRLHFLRLGRVDMRDMGRAPDRFYAGLHHKSRDEIEYDFMAAERILKHHELANYTYQIFDLQRNFKEYFARSHPEALAVDRMDHYFIKALCRLNQDENFWVGSKAEAGLKAHLVRYAVMYFDSCFPSYDPFQDFLRDFMNRHRVYRPAASVRLSLAESAQILGVTAEALKKMDGPTLTRQYRKQALKYHPDKGGDQDIFVRLTAAYEKLMKRKS